MCVEIIATCSSDVKTIVEGGGGNRIELVSGLTEGGLTPSSALIENAIQIAKEKPVMVMIRPHAMSFVMTYADIDIMKKDIQLAKTLGAYGIVLGGITEDRKIDRVLLDEVMPLTQGLQVTFHKAFDRLENLEEGLRVLLEYPFISRVLTSGGMGKIRDNLPILEKLKTIAENKIILLPGGDMTIEDFSAIQKAQISTEIHLGVQVREPQNPLGEISKPLLKEAISMWSASS